MGNRAPTVTQPVVGSMHNASAPDVSQSSSAEFYEDGSRKSGQRPSSQPGMSQANRPSYSSYPQQQPTSQAGPEAFNMSPIAAVLPDQSYQSYGQRYPQGASHSTSVYPTPNMHPYGPTVMSPPPTGNSYNMSYQPQFPGYAPDQASSQHMPHATQINTQFYSNQGFMGGQQPGSPYFVQPTQFSHQNQMYTGPPMATQYVTRGGFTGENRLPVQQRVGTEHAEGISATASPARSSASHSSVVRGPPRKPRQSGHAIWIGNLPPQTDLMSLVLHVCKEAPGLESLFLISKSNCAFANYKDEPSCVAAQAKIHDSRFQTVRLVSRLRRSSVGTVPAGPVPTGPAALTPPQLSVVSTPPRSADRSPQEQGTAIDPTSPGEKDPSSSSSPTDKYFVVKSLTVEDLELSVRNGIWATQTHNEEALNKAFKSAENVYLIFSANKSGEYFGYARMTSPINDDPAAAIEFAPKAQAVEDPDLPKAIPTLATEFAPKGRIIDDSARGTIFWEAETEDVEEEKADEEDDARSNKSNSDVEVPSKAWGKPFKLEWMSTTRLPFYRTRGLRNPWNSNREVKIARDGTELETSVGRRLVGLFHRVPSPVVPSLPQMQDMGFQGVYSQMRPFP